MKSFTDIEQSKKLAEILPLESADMYWLNRHIDLTETKYEVFVIDKSNKYVDFFKSYAVAIDNNEIIPCWSLAALLDLLPSEFTTVGKYATTTYEIKIRKYKFANDVDIYQIAYGNYKFYEDGNSSWKDMINTGEKEELIDAAFEMVCWLKENKKI